MCRWLKKKNNQIFKNKLLRNILIALETYDIILKVIHSFGYKNIYQIKSLLKIASKKKNWFLIIEGYMRRGVINEKKT